jgi:hypothetical protein
MCWVASSIRPDTPRSGISLQCTLLQADPRSLHCTCSCSRRHFQELSLSLQDMTCTFHHPDIHPLSTHTVRAANSSRRSKCYSTWCRLVLCLNSKRDSCLDCFAYKRKLIRPMIILAHPTTRRRLGNARGVSVNFALRQGLAAKNPTQVLPATRPASRRMLARWWRRAARSRRRGTACSRRSLLSTCRSRLRTSGSRHSNLRRSPARPHSLPARRSSRRPSWRRWGTPRTRRRSSPPCRSRRRTARSRGRRTPAGTRTLPRAPSPRRASSRSPRTRSSRGRPQATRSRAPPPRSCPPPP